jgi:Flp pilus assembly protein protease CpaA
MTHPEVASVLVLAPLVVWDLRYHRIPNWLVGMFLIEVLIAAWLDVTTWHWTGAGIALGLGLVADVPGGDLKAMTLLGGLIGPPIVPILALAYGLTAVAWWQGWVRWPWVPLLGACFLAERVASRVL